MDNYEKKYKEALERARKAYNSISPENYGARRIIEDAFPELAESEDEKIMEDIMEAVENWLPYERIEEIRAYLKNQKEQKPAEWSEEDDRILTGIIERGSSQIPPHEPALRGEQMEWLMNHLKSLRPWRRRMPDNDTLRNLSYNDLMELYKAVRDEIKRRTNSVESNIVEKRWSASE